MTLRPTAEQKRAILIVKDYAKAEIARLEEKLAGLQTWLALDDFELVDGWEPDAATPPPERPAQMEAEG